jgi:hypothetical protein
VRVPGTAPGGIPDLVPEVTDSRVFWPNPPFRFTKIRLNFEHRSSWNGAFPGELRVARRKVTVRRPPA